MKALYALPLVLLSLFAVAAPAGAEDLRFEDAEDQLLELLKEFNFDTLEMTENSASCVTYQATKAEKYFYFRLYSNNRFVSSIIWENDRGLRRDTLVHVNEWNRSSWSSSVILDEEGCWKLMTISPCEITLSTDDAFVVVETFLDDVESFVATF